jgi:hypothetical protein
MIGKVLRFERDRKRLRRLKPEEVNQIILVIKRVDYKVTAKEAWTEIEKNKIIKKNNILTAVMDSVRETQCFEGMFEKVIFH